MLTRSYREFAALVRKVHVSTLVGPVGLAARVMDALLVGGESPMLHTAADLSNIERRRDIVSVWTTAADAARADYRDRLARAEESAVALRVPPPASEVPPPLVVFDLQGVVSRDIAMALYCADQAARSGALAWCAVMTPWFDRGIREGTRHGWAEWGSRATDLCSFAETAILLAPTPL